LTPRQLRLLQVEDSPDDAELIVAELRHAGFEVHGICVDSAEAMKAALDDGTWDLIISDYNLPGFSPEAALSVISQ
jgi:DNA-binding response OmpR family regulator